MVESLKPRKLTLPQPETLPTDKSINGFVSVAAAIADTGRSPTPQLFWIAGNRLLVYGTHGDWETYWSWKASSKSVEVFLRNKHAQCQKFSPTYQQLLDLDTKKIIPVSIYVFRDRGNYTQGYRLSDGRIMFLGHDPGDNCSTNFPSTTDIIEIYDPVKASVKLIRPKNQIQRGVVTPLSNGKILITGGYDVHNKTEHGGLLSDASILDPDSGHLEPLMQMASYRSRHGATLMPDKRHVVLVGGACFLRKKNGQILDWIPPLPDNGEHGSLTKSGQLKREREDMYESGANCNSIEYLDLKNRTSKIVGTLTNKPIQNRLGSAYKPPPYIKTLAARFLPGLVALDNHRVLIVSGTAPRWRDRLKHIELFNLQTRKSKIVGTLENQGSVFSSYTARLTDGNAVILSDQYLYLFDSKKEKLIKLDILKKSGNEYTATISPDDKVYIGGTSPFVEVFDYRAFKASWDGTPPPEPVPPHNYYTPLSSRYFH